MNVDVSYSRNLLKSMVSYLSNLFQFLSQSALLGSTLFCPWFHAIPLGSIFFSLAPEILTQLRFVPLFCRAEYSALLCSGAKQLGSRDESLSFVFQPETSHLAPVFWDLAPGFWLWLKNWGNSGKLLVIYLINTCIGIAMRHDGSWCTVRSFNDLKEPGNRQISCVSTT